jgi:glycosyltransferase involved in cell wall biosynthesis
LSAERCVTALPATRVVQLTDWLPPEFSAVSQLALLIAQEETSVGAHVSVIGLNTYARPIERTEHGSGVIEVISVCRPPLNRQTWLKRLAWTFVTNLALLRGAWSHMRGCDIIRFTGSPPFLIYFLVPANFILRKRLVYRITDFYPECIMAAVRRKSWLLDLVQACTVLLRRRIPAFEVLGDDARARLLACGINERRITLRRDWSPVVVRPETPPLPRPDSFRDRKLILYSGNWGVAHDIDTFLEGYRRHHREGPGGVVLWLNATGTGAEEIDARLRAASLPFVRQRLVPLEVLPNLLVAADAHLVTLKPEFMGFVLPCKIYACIESRRPIVYIGPKGSDIHQLCLAEKVLPYTHVDVGDPKSVQIALDALASLPIVAKAS